MTLLLIIFILSVIVLIWAEWAGKKRIIYGVKPWTTLLVIFAAALVISDSTYQFMVISALIFSLGGDIALMFMENKKAFQIGLVSFLFAHIIYILVFLRMGNWHEPSLLPMVVLIVLGLGVYLLLKPGLGRMQKPVIVYIVIITAMVASAWAAMESTPANSSAGKMIVGGAVLFYISDLMLAVNRFRFAFRWNRISLAFYYAGQMMIALAGGWL